MASTIWSSHIGMALIAALWYGLSPPLAKLSAAQFSVSPSGMLFAYGVSAIVMSMIWDAAGVAITFGPTHRGFLFAIFAGLLTSMGYLSMVRGFMLGPMTLVIAIVAISPILSSTIEIAFMDAHLRWWQALGGILFIVLGIVLVTTSKVRM